MNGIPDKLIIILKHQIHDPKLCILLCNKNLLLNTMLTSFVFVHPIFNNEAHNSFYFLFQNFILNFLKVLLSIIHIHGYYVMTDYYSLGPTIVSWGCGGGVLNTLILIAARKDLIIVG